MCFVMQSYKLGKMQRYVTNQRCSLRLEPSLVVGGSVVDKFVHKAEGCGHLFARAHYDMNERRIVRVEMSGSLIQ